MNLGRFPRITLGHLPTPLEPMPRLSKFLDGPNLWVKRDDCTGLATGGNKTRKLEYLLAEAQEENANVVVTPGAYQSNHARQTAAAAARLGLECHLVLEHRLPDPDGDYRRSGNRFLDGLLGARVHEVPFGQDAASAMHAVCDSLRAEGRNVYAIPGGGSNATGALAYVGCAVELMHQTAALSVGVDHLVVATGSGGTLAGLGVGFGTMNTGFPVLGFSVHQSADVHHKTIGAIAEAAQSRLDLNKPSRLEVEIDDQFIGPGYGVPTEAMREAVRLTAELEGILLDPVYSGKAMAGLIDGCRTGRFKAGENVVFLHTGGASGLFAYLDALKPEP